MRQLSTPTGTLYVQATREGVIHIGWRHPLVHQTTCPSHEARAIEQLEAYFAGRLNAFDVPIAPHGTAFQQMVWRALLTIPYGALRTYQDIADAIGRPTAVRAVANAIGANPIAIMIPCHRVIGRNRQLTGFGGGLVNKRILLEHEGHKMTDATDLKRAKVI